MSDDHNKTQYTCEDEQSIGRKKIIVVDDVNFSLVTVKSVLKTHYEVYPAPSVDSMFRILERVGADLILLDINMPHVNGFDAIRMLKEDTRYAHIPVIFLSSSAESSSVVKGLSLGAVDHVPKPFSAPDLLERIDYHLYPHKRTGELSVEGIDGDDDHTKPIILAVDDSPSMLRSIHFALREKYKVYTLPKSENVKDFLNKTTPELFLLDYKMPVVDGFELVSVIRSFAEHKDTPIIFLTSEGSADHLNTAVQLGACDFIVKPFNTAALQEKIEKHLNAR